MDNKQTAENSNWLAFIKDRSLYIVIPSAALLVFLFFVLVSFMSLRKRGCARFHNLISFG